MYSNRDRCRLCNSRRLVPYLDLGLQPLANSLVKSGETSETMPLQVAICQDYFLSQLDVVVDPRAMFDTYLYVSGTTGTLTRHLQELAGFVANRYGGRSHLDVACNDGTLMEAFRALGYTVKGVDPARNLRDVTRAKQLDVEVAYWNDQIKLDRPYDVITATNVFAHVDDVHGFLRTAHRWLTDDGVLVIEVIYHKAAMEIGAFDVIYHEHVSYYLLRPLLPAFQACGFAVADVMLVPIHGGSLRIVIKKRPAEQNERSIQPFVDDEADSGLTTIEPYRRFAEQVAENKRALRELLAASPRKSVGFGASAKCTVMANYFDVALDYIVDENPLKCGLCVPGKNVPIRPFERFAREPEPLNIVLTAWNFADEIRAKVGKARPNVEDCFVSYVPEVSARMASEPCAAR